MQTAYEERVAEARAELDRVASRQLLDQTSFEGRMHELLSRQARIEQHDRLVEALAAEAGPAKAPVLAVHADAPSKPTSASIHLLEQNARPGPTDNVFTPATHSATPDAGSIEPVIAPKPHPADEAAKGESLGALSPSPDDPQTQNLVAAEKNPALDASARLGLIAFSLDRVEGSQLRTLAGIETRARSQSARLDAIVARAGLSADQLSPPAQKGGGMGGPFIPIEADATAPAFDKAASRAAREVALADKLRRLIVYVPVREPLTGDVSVSSPFGYRPDPFLGRPALHPGIDLVQSYGAEIKATAAGRVVHAGWMGGYGNMVEIDHGNGIATRYGHMSEVLVAEGDEVKPGAVLGRIGSTGRSTGPHLHYEVRLDGEPVDPARFLDAGAPSAADGG
jgi:murein DD-endopeptidase MepM/ murein hydrolase activator NlpD